MEPQEETADPQEALQEVWRWLSSGGPHFPGGWSLDTDDKKREHHAKLQIASLPKDLHTSIRAIIRQVALGLGWRAVHVRFTREHVEFALKPYRVEVRQVQEAQREVFRQAARRKREGTRTNPEGGQTPAP